jgi:hypothetical protein
VIDFRSLVRSPLLTALGAAATVLPAPQVHDPVPMVSTRPDFRALVQRGESRVFVPIEPG